MRYQSALLSEARGKLGGAVFSRDMGGNCIRKKAIPTQRFSPSQQLRKQQQKIIIAYWRAMSDAERAAWSAKASSISRSNVFGDNYYSSGFALFRERQFNALIIGYADIVTPTAQRDVSTVPYEIREYTVSSLNIRPVGEFVAPNSSLVVSLAYQRNGMGAYKRISYRIVYTRTSAAAPAAPIRAPYISAFGDWSSEFPTFIRYWFIDETTFQRSQYFYLIVPPL